MADPSPSINQQLDELKKELGQTRTELEKTQTEYKTDRTWLFRFFFFMLAVAAVIYKTTVDQIPNKISEQLAGTAIKQIGDSAQTIMRSIVLQKIKSDSILKASFEQEKLTIFQGSTPEGNTSWAEFQNGVTVTVNTESYQFKSTPTYVAVLLGTAGIWSTMGVTSIYNPTPKSFTVYIRPYDPKNKDVKVTPAIANQAKWQIQWIALLPK